MSNKTSRKINETDEIPTDEMLVEWMTPEEIRNTDIGLSYEEHIEAAYENVVTAYCHIQLQNIRLRKALKQIASYQCCETPGCCIDDPMCDAMVARAALKASNE